jgi:hypothetical protein
MTARSPVSTLEAADTQPNAPSRPATSTSSETPPRNCRPWTSATPWPSASRVATPSRIASRAALRWLARFCVERRDATLAEVSAAATAFAQMAEEPAQALETLRKICN